MLALRSFVRQLDCSKGLGLSVSRQGRLLRPGCGALIDRIIFIGKELPLLVLRTTSPCRGQLFCLNFFQSKNAWLNV